MKTSKKVTQSNRTLSRYQILMGLVLLTLVVVIALISQRLVAVERYIGLMGLSATMRTSADDAFRPLVVDAAAKTAAIPELGLTMPYDAWLTSDVRYDVLRDDGTTSGTVLVTTAPELHKSIDKIREHSPNQKDGCRVAYRITVGDADIDANESVEEVSRRTLSDGRSAVMYKTTDKSCGVYFNGNDSAELATLLQKINSY